MRRIEKLDHPLPSTAGLDHLNQIVAPADSLAVSVSDWAEWLRGVERNQRALLRKVPHGMQALPPIYFAHATYVSFRLDGIELLRQDVTDALAMTPTHPPMRSRTSQRVRNHVGILRRLEHSIHLGEPLSLGHGLQWYTSISCGLCGTELNDSTLTRLDRVIRQINSPQLKLQKAVQQIVDLHAELMLDPIVPSFNGIFVRLLLRYHLGKSHLPPVFFDPEMDPAVLRDAIQLLPKLRTLIDDSYRFLKVSE